MRRVWTALKAELLKLHREDDGFWNLLIPAAASLFGGMLGGKKESAAAKKRAGGATLQELMPLMMDLIKQQQAQSGQNYTLQQQRYQANLPMQDAIRSMAMGMLPKPYTQSLPMPKPLSQPAPPRQTEAVPRSRQRLPRQEY